MIKISKLYLFLTLFLTLMLINPVLAISYVDLERTKIGGKAEGYYPENILITNLEPSYKTKLLNATNELIANATADTQGIANMTVPTEYLTSAFQGTFHIYDSNSTFLYSKWFEDIHGGDEYEIKRDEDWVAIAAFAVVMSMVCIALTFTRRKQQ